MSITLDDLNFELEITNPCAPPFENSVSSLRRQFCGGSFDLAKLEAAGFQPIHRDGGIYMILLKDSPISRMEQRLFFSKTAVLRNILTFRISRKYTRTIHQGLTDNLDLLELLGKSVKTPVPASAEDEWMILAEVSIPKAERAGASQEQIVKAWLKGLEWYAGRFDLETAARFITGALRYPEYCRDGTVLARAAWIAINSLDMDAEALELARLAAKRMLAAENENFEVDVSPDWLEHIAQVCQAMGELKPALMAQYLFCEESPENKAARNTLWNG